jgi:histone H3/H4
MEMLVVASKVKSFLKEKGCHTSGELVDALNAKVAALLSEAVKRTRGNKRSTVKDVDL